MTSESTQQVEEITESLADFHGQLDDIYVAENDGQASESANPQNPQVDYNRRQLALAMVYVNTAKLILENLVTTQA